MTAAPHAEHGPEALCAAGTELYERALREGRVSGADAEAAPCLVDFGLLHPAVADLDRLEPASPALALHRLLRAFEERIADERRREQRLAETFEPLLRIGLGQTAGAGSDTPAISVLSGFDRINLAIAEALADASAELLAIHPYTSHTRARAERHAEALVRDQDLLDRGGRIRTLYQHTLRHAPSVLARYELLRGDVEARTLDEVTERLLVVDRAVAFVPGSKDRSLALEVRHPALVDYFATTFDRLWQLATPMYPQAAQQPSLDGVTHRQRAIAALLVEGLTDAVIADRLGMNIRTARVHIAKLAATLGSESRAQLGYLIARSGILDREP
ncbi:helix-turn-helix transcriptional regulator [Streptomyces luteolifulvus]|uniref:Helix-turn-helix transcriptional regulator n=1 Tax=Streptomyces luteolifulvus TaxID=2615112 RepID=A0A6H9UTZ7_9ACTN|nr:helix-turn-helix transcriptional regulator [Streptomyces luteolifulvus]KAB1143239.1 helix-turn-helix transcriptional regulator [Streptomyces luteolifulvus]